MPDKYIFHGATFNGDGTSSAAAASNGGVGAWNNINIFQGTAPSFGTLAAGDRVFVRTKDAAGAEITVGAGTAMTLGSLAATDTAPITWVFDNGAVWPGVSGQVRYQTTASVTITVADWNNIKAYNHNLEFGTTFLGSTNQFIPALGTGWTEEVGFDLTGLTHVSAPSVIGTKGGVHFRPKVKASRHATGVIVQRGVTGFSGAVLHDPDIELTNATLTAPVFSTNNCRDGAPVKVYGGRIYGVGAAGGCPVAGGTINAGNFMSFGLEYPREMPISNQAYTPATFPTSKVADGSDGGFGSEYFDYCYAYTSRSDNFPPTLNAYYKLAGGATKYWSYRLYPYRTSEANPVQLTVQKTWRQAAAAQTITQELLWPDSMAAPTKDQVYIVVQYTDDATGQLRSLSSRDLAGGALDVSTAAWSATTWGLVSLNKRKLSVTTPTAIRQDTAVLVTLFVAPRSATVNDVMFVCPDPVFSTP